MPTFNYKAKDREGKLITGSLDAVDSKSAAGKIRELGCWPIEISEVGAPRVMQGSPQTSTQSGIGRVNVAAQAAFFRQFATMLHSGMAIGESLDSLARQRGIGKLAAIAGQSAQQVRAGRMLSEAFSAHPGAFSKLQIGLIKAGETGGMLDQMIERIATYLEREAELRRKFSRITFYPKIIAVFVALILIFVPHIPEIVRDTNKIVPIITQQVMPIILGLIVLSIVFKLLLTIGPIGYAWDSFKLSFPGVGNVVRKLAMSRFSLTMSVLYSSGLQLPQALEYSADSLGNAVLERAVRRAIPEVRANGNFTAALTRTGKIPDLVLGMISTGERTGNMDTVLEKVSEYYESESAAAIEKMGYVLFVLLIVGAAIVVGYIVLQFWSQFYGGLSQAGAG